MGIVRRRNSKGKSATATTPSASDNHHHQQQQQHPESHPNVTDKDDETQSQASQGGGGGAGAGESKQPPSPNSSTPSRKSRMLTPPWKRRGKQQQHQHQQPQNPSNSTTDTDEDPRGVVVVSGPHDDESSSHNYEHESSENDTAIVAGTCSSSCPPSPTPPLKPVSPSASLPPWKRGARKHSNDKRLPNQTRSQHSDMDTMPNKTEEDKDKQQEKEKEQPPIYGIKSNIPSTFKGERGGVAKDDELLLAELRAVSARSRSADHRPPTKLKPREDDPKLLRQTQNKVTGVHLPSHRGNNWPRLIVHGKKRKWIPLLLLHHCTTESSLRTYSQPSMVKEVVSRTTRTC